MFEDLECDGEPAPADALVDLDMRPVLVPAGLEVGGVAAAAEGTIVLDDDHGRVIGPHG